MGNHFDGCGPSSHLQTCLHQPHFTGARHGQLLYAGPASCCTLSALWSRRRCLLLQGSGSRWLWTWATGCTSSRSQVRAAACCGAWLGCILPSHGQVHAAVCCGGYHVVSQSDACSCVLRWLARRLGVRCVQLCVAAASTASHS